MRMELNLNGKHCHAKAEENLGHQYMTVTHDPYHDAEHVLIQIGGECIRLVREDTEALAKALTTMLANVWKREES